MRKLFIIPLLVLLAGCGSNPSRVVIKPPIDGLPNLSFQWNDTLADIKKRFPDINDDNETVYIPFMFDGYKILFSVTFNFDTKGYLQYVQHGLLFSAYDGIPLIDIQLARMHFEKLYDYYCRTLESTLDSKYTKTILPTEDSFAISGIVWNSGQSVITTIGRTLNMDSLIVTWYNPQAD